MKDLFNISLSVLNAIMTIAKISVVQRCYQYKKITRKVITYAISFVFLLVSFIFGYISLYNYLIPYWGQTVAALSLCLLSLFIGGVLILSTKVLKARKPQSSNQLFTLLEERFGEILKDQDLICVLKNASPQALITVTILSVVTLASYVVFRQKKK